MKIYVVECRTGKCEPCAPCAHWHVCAFNNKEKAEEFIVQLTKEANTYMERVLFKDFFGLISGELPNDPDFMTYSTGFHYRICELELRE